MGSEVYPRVHGPPIPSDLYLPVGDVIAYRLVDHAVRDVALDRDVHAGHALAVMVHNGLVGVIVQFEDHTARWLDLDLLLAVPFLGGT